MYIPTYPNPNPIHHEKQKRRSQDTQKENNHIHYCIHALSVFLFII